VRAAPDGGWLVDLNTEALPRVVANRSFYARISGKADKEVRSFVDEAWTSANWIVAQPRTAGPDNPESGNRDRAPAGCGSSPTGVAHIRPLNLKTIADAVSLHDQRSAA